MPRSPSTSPPRLDKKDASSPAATTTAARGGGGGGGDTLCRSPTEEEVPLLVVDSNSSSSDTSSCSSRDNNVACWEKKKKKKKSVIPASRVHSIHAAFGCDCDLYKDVLQVSRDATDAQIRIAYFRRGRQVLADTAWANNDAMDKKKNKNRRGANPNNSSATVMADLPVSQKERFQAVSLAYEILCKSSWKQEYDTYGWKLASITTTTSTFPPKPKADCKVTTSTTITDIPGIKITSTTSTAEETPNPSFFSFRMDNGSGSRSPSEISPAASSEQASSILRNPSTTPANMLAASSSNVSQSDRSSVAGNSINRTPRIRWSEEVEELVYRQDPEESRFKMRGSHSYDEDDSASGSGSEGSASSATSSTGSRDYNHDENGHDEVSAGAAAHLYGNMAVSENTFSPKNEGKMSQDGNSIREEDGATTPKTKGKRKMIVVDSGSIQCRLSKLEKKTFENTFVTAFLNDIDRSLDGLEDSFDGMFGSKQLLVDMDDDEDDDDRHQPASGVEPVSEKVQQDTSPQSKRLDPAKVIPFSPVAVLEDVDDDNDSTVLNLFSELTKPARVLFHNTAAMSDDSPSSTAQAPSDKTSSPSETPAVETRMAETDRAFSPIMHQEKSKDPFGFTDTSFTAFEDAFDPFNDSFQTEAEEKKDEPFQPMTKTDALGEAHSCSTPSCSVQLNKEPFEPPLLESFTLHHGSTRNRVPLRPSTPNPPPPLATETYHMDTSLPSSPIRGDTIFPRTHSGMSSLTGPASIVTNDTDIMLNEAGGNGRGLCTSLLEHSKDGTEAELGMKNVRAAKKQPEETHDFFAHFISYMDALAKDFQQFSQGPCRVVDEATQVIIDAVVIPEEDLESMLAAFQVEGPPPSCMDKNSPSSCAENAPIITRSYTL
jgi:curved DNA-binding protein CbpA